MIRTFASRAVVAVILCLLILPWARSAPPDATAPEPADANLLEVTLREQRLIADALRADVEFELKRARAQMADHAVAVEQRLKLMLERVARAPELSAELRGQLRGMLEPALRAAHAHSASAEVVARQIHEAQAAARERLNVVDALARKQETVRQLMERFDALMEQGQLNAAEEPALRSTELAPELPAASAAVWTNRQTRNHIAAQVARVARQSGVVSTLATAETALVPVPDDPPIAYASAESWQALTESRRRHFSADMQRPSPATAKIRATLREPTNMQFAETPLADMVDYLKDLHGIEIQLDAKALADAQIGNETPITCNLRGISLRTALRLTLDAIDLTYVVRDEVLLITTPDRAASELSTRVYPLADLVTPIRSSQGGMLGANMPGMNPGGNSSGSGMPGNNQRGMPGMPGNNGPGPGF